jgi:large subunit ribosomal protein L19
MNAIDWIEKKYLKKKIPEFKAGDTVKVHVKIKEGDKERIQIFQGTVIKIHRGGSRASFTVRKMSYGIGVERVFPFHSPVVHKIEVISRGKVRRAKLYYMRKLRGKKARITALDKDLRPAPEPEEEETVEEKEASAEVAKAPQAGASENAQPALS